MEIAFFIKHLTLVKRYSPHTINAYKTDLLQFKKYLNQENLLFATGTEIRNFLKSLTTKGYSLRTVNRKLEVLKSFYRYHWRHGDIEKSPCLNIPKFRFKRPKGRFIPVENVLQILENINPGINRKILRDQLILEILYFTGVELQKLSI